MVCRKDRLLVDRIDRNDVMLQNMFKRLIEPLHYWVFFTQLTQLRFLNIKFGRNIRQQAVKTKVSLEGVESFTHSLKGSLDDQ